MLASLPFYVAVSAFVLLPANPLPFSRALNVSSASGLRSCAKAPCQPVELQLEGPLLRDASIETLQPEPQRAMSHGQAMLFQLGTQHDGVATLYLTLRSEHVGTLECIVRAGPESAVHYSTFLYP